MGARRYELLVDVVVLLHTATEPQQRNHGYASALVEQVLTDLDADGRRTVVRCPFVRWYLDTSAAG